MGDAASVYDEQEQKAAAQREKIPENSRRVTLLQPTLSATGVGRL